MPGMEWVLNILLMVLLAATLFGQDNSDTPPLLT